SERRVLAARDQRTLLGLAAAGTRGGRRLPLLPLPGRERRGPAAAGVVPGRPRGARRGGGAEALRESDGRRPRRAPRDLAARAHDPPSVEGVVQLVPDDPEPGRR